MGPFNNYVTLRGGGGLSDALRSEVKLKVTLKSVTKGGGGSKIVQKGVTLLLNGPHVVNLKLRRPSIGP